MVFERTTAEAGDTQNASTHAALTSGLPAGTIALTGSSTEERTVLWTRRGLRDPGIEGRAFGWSPDGSRLLIKRGEGLYVVRADGSGEVQIAKAGSGYNAVWSPDGARIAFEAGPGTRSGENSIYTVRPDGTGLRRLPGAAVDGSFFSGNLTWSPDGRELLFAGRTTAHRRLWLYLVRADGRAPARPFPIGAEMWRPMQPAWSPDGTRIAFSAGEAFSAPHLRGGIYVINADGTAVRWVAPGHGPVWSPDGSKIAFRGNGNQTVHADGTHLATLPPGSWGGLSWSPDSKRVAYTGGASHVANGDVFVARADGTGLARLVHERALRYVLPLWRHGTASTETG